MTPTQAFSALLTLFKNDSLVKFVIKILGRGECKMLMKISRHRVVQTFFNAEGNFFGSNLDLP